MHIIILIKPIFEIILLVVVSLRFKHCIMYYAVCRSTRLKETLQKKWADEAAAAKASPYTSTCRETYKRLPAIDTGVVKVVH